MSPSLAPVAPNTQTAQPAPAPQAQDQHAADTQHHRGVLHDLIDMGADLARMVHRQAQAETLPATEASVAFERIARATRRTILLAQRLAEPAADAGRQRIAVRKQIIRAVEDEIQREASDADAGALQAELIDRLDGADLDDDIDRRPAADIIADICRDLGLATPPGAHPWKRRTPSDVAALCARAASPAPHQQPGVEPPPRNPAPWRGG